MKYRKKPVVIEATQWFRNGDHPLDVSYYNRGCMLDETLCKHCDKRMYDHGWIDTLEGGHVVCPGDWVITGVKGEHYPCKPEIFEMTREDIIRMARESGFCFNINDPVVYAAHEHLAALHAAHEREECAKVCESGIIETNNWDVSYWNQACENAAFRIRAREEK